mmetsp:Transcript_14370/g.26116  ORF Transcript_14370/g.26116 Transcript_14370/m.26116 type:complete len:208 (-) Transcript_14370:46-669(-)|eukprot:CAMPEP_0198291648 /NCGR_PEP_ID=MMETSP1449-20131203/9113_1 /TAXON_ID=420275 /ORGANISM="Attheya septentrionalis, Strain CCMP2084" /LENGTH=207 /DNA_ID=CAMNT_0043990317 /DNA_START=139 /DNA_END=762 /DNA_ORIENTATION=+
MGNGQAKRSKRMAMEAMSHMVQLTKNQLLELREKCYHYCIHDEANDENNEHSFNISREDFRAAMQDVGIADVDLDAEVLDKLFTMWDLNEVDRIPLLEFLTGVTPLTSWADVQSKLQFAFEVFDIHREGRLRESDTLSVLASINSTAAYFGDPILTTDQIKEVIRKVYDVHQDREGFLCYRDHVDKICAHKTIIQFINGQGPARYGA